jgi:hypothetical protein
MQPVPVDVPELHLAFAAEAGDVCWYLDTLTGDVLLVSREWEPSEHGGLTRAELNTNTARFRRVPSADSGIGRLDMEAYAAQVTDERLRESLDLALSAPRPDRRFRAVLGWLPEEQERWRRFRQTRCEARAKEWLATVGIVVKPRAG